jgi:hypothetical protein
MKSQHELCYDASHQAAKEMLNGMIAKLYAERSLLVQAWRDGGQSEKLWSPVDEIDAIIDSQEKILMEM